MFEDLTPDERSELLYCLEQKIERLKERKTVIVTSADTLVYEQIAFTRQLIERVKSSEA